MTSPPVSPAPVAGRGLLFSLASRSGGLLS